MDLQVEVLPIEPSLPVGHKVVYNLNCHTFQETVYNNAIQQWVTEKEIDMIRKREKEKKLKWREREIVRERESEVAI